MKKMTAIAFTTMIVLMTFLPTIQVKAFGGSGFKSIAWWCPEDYQIVNACAIGGVDCVPTFCIDRPKI